MDFFAVISFLALYYIRPHEWIVVVRALRPVVISIDLAILSLLLRYQGLSWRDFFKTPHDWLMIAYFIWFYLFSPTMTRTITQSWHANPMPIYYLVAVVTLTSLTRLQSFLNWWTFFIVALAAMAVASTWGFDPTNSADVTAAMKGRLAMSTSIFRNPNALGHSIVPAITMLYFVGIWQRPIFVRIPMLFALSIPLYCIWLTVSKGAFLTAFATIITALAFRRPKSVQIFIVVLSLTAGWSAVQLLPRMQEVGDSKSDQAIQGRVAAFSFGLDTMKSQVRGVGYPNFQLEFYKKNHYWKAPHSSYVRVGTEQGMVGLFLFLGILYCCAHTLVFAITTSDAEERVRRTLFVMLVSYAVSSWMVGWSDRCTFFLMVAAIGAFHRHLLSHADVPEVEDNSPAQPRITFATPAVPQLTAPVQTPATTRGIIGVPTTEIVVESGSKAEAKLAALALWNRVGWLDLVLIGVLTYCTIEFWGYIMHKM